MSNQPVYRRPRSHAYSCRCPRCGEPAGSGLIRFDMIAIAVALLFIAVMWIVMAPLRIWHVIGSDGQEHPDTADLVRRESPVAAAAQPRGSPTAPAGPLSWRP